MGKDGPNSHSLRTHRLGAGELGGDVEVDEVLSHDHVGHAVAIVSHLQDTADGAA